MTDVAVRPSAVAGAFYPADPGRLGRLVAGLLEEASSAAAGAGPDGAELPLGILVPHAGLVYSGVTAAAGWACLRRPSGAAPGPAPAAVPGPTPAAAPGPAPAAAHGPPPTVVILGTNHVAGWLDGVAAWDGGSWECPGGETNVDASLTGEVLRLGPPFVADRAAHLGEHSIEVQLPLLAAVAPGARIVPLAVACGTGERARDAGERLGRLLAARRAAGESIVLAISTDMAHYPAAAACAEVTERLLPTIASMDAVALAAIEGSLRGARIPGLACGMCGIQPAVLGLAALRAMGAARGLPLAATTSADAGGPAERTVGYLAVRFDV